jgi:hypothetical protein
MRNGNQQHNSSKNGGESMHSRLVLCQEEPLRWKGSTSEKVNCDPIGGSDAWVPLPHKTQRTEKNHLPELAPQHSLMRTDLNQAKLPSFVRHS